MATLVTMNITTKGNTPSRGAPMPSKTGVSLKIQASSPSRTHGTTSISPMVRWSARSWASTRPAVARVRCSVHRAASSARSMRDRKAPSASAAPVRASSSGRVVVGEDLALAQQQEPVAAARLVHDVARHEQRTPLGRKAVEQVPQVATQDRVEPDGGLVEDQQLGVADEGGRRARRGSAGRPESRPTSDVGVAGRGRPPRWPRRRPTSARRGCWRSSGRWPARSGRRRRWGSG